MLNPPSGEIPMMTDGVFVRIARKNRTTIKGQTLLFPLLKDVNKQKEKAEEQEVAGRHKNDGPKDHKGAR